MKNVESDEEKRSKEKKGCDENTIRLKNNEPIQNKKTKVKNENENKYEK